MRQFITSNLVASEMMIPNVFTKEQVFAMCEELQRLSFYGKAISKLEENNNKITAVDNEYYNEKLFLTIKKLLVETGEVPLDDAIGEFTKATKLAANCDKKLKNAEEAITKLVKENGETTDFQVEEQ